MPVNTRWNTSVADSLLAALPTDVLGTAGEFTTKAPFDGEALFTVPLSSRDDVRHAYDLARAAQPAWARRTPDERAAVFNKVHIAVLDRQDELVDLLQLEVGKSRADAFSEALGCAVVARYYARKAPGLLRLQRREGLVPVLTQAYLSHQPKGVVGICAAWNFPAVFTAFDGFPALIAGNGLVHRPDSQAVVTCLWLRRVAIEAGLPAQLWQVVTGSGPDIGEAVLDAADYAAFTGSSAVGAVVATRAGARLSGVSLELGGKNSLIVLADADVDKAAAGAVRSVFTNSGQACVGTERILVAEQISAQFEAAFIAKVRALRVGTGLNYGYDIGPLVGLGQVERVEAHVRDAVAKGARVLVGGNRLPGVSPYAFEPTVMADVVQGMLCRDTETFGPLVAIESFSTVEQAVQSANATDLGLAAAVWTSNVKAGIAIAQRLRAGTVDVNDAYAATWGSVDLPQGGMRRSGLGRRNGPDGLLRFTEAQGIAASRVHGLYPPGSMPAQTFATLMSAAVGLLRRTRLR